MMAKDYEDSDDAKNLMAAAKREKKDYERSQMSDEPGATESLRDAAARMGATKPKSMTFGKAPVVTKEQMQKAGFDNLRDYLNAQRGLKRRDKFTSEAQKRAFAAAPRGTQTEGGAGESDARQLKEAASYAARMRADREKYMRQKQGATGMKKGGMVSASKRADGCAIRGKTKGKMV
jgi:hypothetical protein